MLRHSKLMLEIFEPNLSTMPMHRAALLDFCIFFNINLLHFFLVSLPSLLPTLAERTALNVPLSPKVLPAGV